MNTRTKLLDLGGGSVARIKSEQYVGGRHLSVCLMTPQITIDGQTTPAGSHEVYMGAEAAQQFLAALTEALS